MTAATIEEYVPQVKEIKQNSPLQMKAQEYIKKYISRPEKCTNILAKEIIANRFYRVNFYSIKNPDHVIKVYDIIESRFVEVIEVASGYEIIDRTVKT